MKKFPIYKILISVSFILILFAYYVGAHLPLLKLSMIGLVCILVFTSSLSLSKSHWLQKIIGYSIILANIIFTLTYFIAYLFTEEGFNFAVLSHISLDSIEAGFYAWLPYHSWLVLIAVSFSSLLLCSFKLNAIGVNIKYPINRYLGVPLILCAFLVHPGSHDLIRLKYATNQDSVDELLMEQYEVGRFTAQDLKKVSLELESKPDVLIIFLEGMERTYLQEGPYPDLANNLSQLLEESQTYENFTPSWAASHTIAGIVTAMCGLPYAYLNGATMQHGGGDFYMPQAQCLGDVTRELGYKNIYMQGANLSFSRKGSFFRAHGFDDIKGRFELEKGSLESDMASWGLQDSYIFDKAFDKLELLRDQPDRDPFLMTMLTLDGHDPWSRNYISKWCLENDLGKYPDDKRDHPIQDSVFCTDNLLPHFLDRIKVKWGDSIDIYLVSDHLAPPHSIGDRHKTVAKEDRKLIFSKVNGSLNKAENNRKISHLDVAATILDNLTQGKLNKLGFGVSADSRQETLIETYGSTELNSRLQKSIKGIAKMLWDQPNLKKHPIQFSFGEKKIFIDDREFPFPLAIPISENGEMLNFHSAYIDKYIQLLKESSRLVYFDTCKNVKKYSLSLDAKDSDTCLMIGNLGSSTRYSATVDADLEISYDKFSEFLAQPTDNSIFNDFLYNNHGQDFKESSAFSTGSPTVHPIAKMQFVAGERITKTVMNYFYPTVFDEPEFQNKRAEGINGFILYGISKGKVTHVNMWIGDCENPKEGEQIAKLLRNEIQIDNFVLLTSQKGKCGPSLDKYFTGSPFEDDIKELQYHEPFIGYYNKKTGRYISKTGSKKEHLIFTLVDDAIYGKHFQ